MKKKIVDFMKRLCASDLTTSLGGNMSFRISEDRVLITPSSIDKAELKEDEIVVLDMNGNIVEGKNKPSMEYMMHLAVYQKRLDINAIIHAHPHYSTLFSSATIPINLNFTAEACKNIQSIGMAEYMMMGTRELADEVADKAKENNVVLMKNHGALTVGEDLLEAFYRMEVLEQAAKMTYHSLALSLNELSMNDIVYLKNL